MKFKVVALTKYLGGEWQASVCEETENKLGIDGMYRSPETVRLTLESAENLLAMLPSVIDELARLKESSS